MKRILSAIGGILLTLVMQAHAADFDSELLAYQERWAQTQYSSTKKAKQAEFETLAEQLKTLATQNPNRPEPLIWRGIVLSTWAGAKGGLGALGLVKEAKTLFEQSIAIDPNALAGSAYTSLGSLYYQVPGWPVAFGDDEKAKELLEKALRINPTGIDSNYFYGDYWLEQGDYQKARQYLTKAQQAEKRPQRPLADAGRQADIKAKLDVVAEKLK